MNFNENPSLIHRFLPVEAWFEINCKAYRNGGTGGVGSISRGGKGGQGPAAAISPETETSTDESLSSNRRLSEKSGSNTIS